MRIRLLGGSNGRLDIAFFGTIQEEIQKNGAQ
jgi:hypothetical protein